MDQPSLYDDDIVTWAEQQTSTLRELARRTDQSDILDRENVAEESVGRSQIAAVESPLAQTLAQLLERLSAPNTLPVEHWRKEAGTFQVAAFARYERSMRQRLDWDKIWSVAQAQAKLGLISYGDTLLPHLPARCPLGPDDLLVPPFDPDAALRAIAAAAALKSPNQS